jgi:hypothetical protein
MTDMARAFEPPFRSFRAAVETLLATAPPTAEWFSKTFVMRAPMTQVAAVVADLLARGGRPVKVAADGGHAEVELEHARVDIDGSLDREGRIAALRLGPLRPLERDASALAEALRRVRGRVGLVVLRNDREVMSLNRDRELAIGSCFKLGVLAALVAEIDRGARAWSDVVELEDQWRSGPAGLAHQWPAGSSVTLETLALLMLSMSDNTATDALMCLLGREAVETASSLRRPVLTTREAFVLRSPENADLLARYSAARGDGRRRVLSDCAHRSLPAAHEADAAPNGGEVVEWFSTALGLATIMARVGDQRVLSAHGASLVPSYSGRAVYKMGADSAVEALAVHLGSGKAATTVGAIRNGSRRSVCGPSFAATVLALAEAVAGGSDC